MGALDVLTLVLYETRPPEEVLKQWFDPAQRHTAVSPVLLSECLRIQIERMYPSILPKRLIWYEQQLEQLPPNPRELFPCSVRGWIRNVFNSAFKEDSQYARRS